MNAQKNTNNILETETKLRQTVFDLMNGSLNLKEYPVPESNYVKNEYEEGKIFVTTCMVCMVSQFERLIFFCLKFNEVFYVVNSLILEISEHNTIHVVTKILQKSQFYPFLTKRR